MSAVQVTASLIARAAEGPSARKYRNGGVYSPRASLWTAADQAAEHRGTSASRRQHGSRQPL